MPAKRAAAEATSSGESGAGTGGVQSIERAFELLEALADGGGTLGLPQLASTSGLPLPTIHRLIRTLVALGYVRQEKSRHYVLGPRLIRLGESAGQMLSTWAMPHLTALVQSLGETANLAMLDGDQIVYIAQVPGRHSMRMFTEVGRRVSPHCTAVGKALLAHLPEGEIDAVIRSRGLKSFTRNTITSATLLKRELKTIRERGYAVDNEEIDEGLRCIGAPVRDFSGRVVASMSIAGPAFRVSKAKVSALANLVIGVAERLSQELGYRPRQSKAT
jgi:IclR family transcriptional regulator, acetate operon repressor